MLFRSIKEYEEEIGTIQNQYDTLFEEKEELEREKTAEIETLTEKIKKFKKQFETIL